MVYSYKGLFLLEAFIERIYVALFLWFFLGPVTRG